MLNIVNKIPRHFEYSNWIHEIDNILRKNSLRIIKAKANSIRNHNVSLIAHETIQELKSEFYDISQITIAPKKRSLFFKRNDEDEETPESIIESMTNILRNKFSDDDKFSASKSKMLEIINQDIADFVITREIFIYHYKLTIAPLRNQKTFKSSWGKNLIEMDNQYRIIFSKLINQAMKNPGFEKPFNDLFECMKEWVTLMKSNDATFVYGVVLDYKWESRFKSIRKSFMADSKTMNLPKNFLSREIEIRTRYLVAADALKLFLRPKGPELEQIEERVAQHIHIISPEDMEKDIDFKTKTLMQKSQKFETFKFASSEIQSDIIMFLMTSTRSDESKIMLVSMDMAEIADIKIDSPKNKKSAKALRELGVIYENKRKFIFDMSQKSDTSAIIANSYLKFFNIKKSLLAQKKITEEKIIASEEKPSSEASSSNEVNKVENTIEISDEIEMVQDANKVQKVEKETAGKIQKVKPSPATDISDEIQSVDSELIEDLELPLKFKSDWGNELLNTESLKNDLEDQILEKLSRVKTAQVDYEAALTAWYAHVKTDELPKTLDDMEDHYQYYYSTIDSSKLSPMFMKTEFELRANVLICSDDILKSRIIKLGEKSDEYFELEEKLQRLLHIVRPEVESPRVFINSKIISVHNIADYEEEKNAIEEFKKLDIDTMDDQLKYSDYQMEIDHDQVNELMSKISNMEFLASQISPATSIYQKLNDLVANKKNENEILISHTRGYERIHIVLGKIYREKVTKLTGKFIETSENEHASQYEDEHWSMFGSEFDPLSQSSSAVGEENAFSMGFEISDIAFNMLKKFKTHHTGKEKIDIYNFLPAAAREYRLKNSHILAKRDSLEEVYVKIMFIAGVIIPSGEILERDGLEMLERILKDK